MGEVYLSDEATISLLDALAEEVIKQGEAEALLIGSDKLSESEMVTLMKTNTFLTAFAMVILKIVRTKNTKFAREILKVWTSNQMQELIEQAFLEEIQSANQTIANQIDELERFVNNEGSNND